MTPHPAIETFLHEIDDRLARFGRRRARVVEEARAHLYDQMESGHEGGLSPDAAASEALGRFGSLETFVGQFEPVLAQELTEMERITRIIAGLSGLSAVGGGILSLVTGRAPLDVLVGTLLVALVVGGGAVVALLPGFRRRAGINMLMGLALVAVGSAGVVWTLLRGQMTGDPEYWAALLVMTYGGFGLLLCWQAWVLRAEPVRPA